MNLNEKQAKLLTLITKIIKNTTVLNSLLGLKEYSLQNYQNNVNKDAMLFYNLLEKYIPKQELIDISIEIKKEEIAEDMLIYRDHKNNLLTTLIPNILSPAVQLKHCIYNYKSDDDVSHVSYEILHEIMEDIKLTLFQLGIPLFIFEAYSGLFCV